MLRFFLICLKCKSFSLKSPVKRTVSVSAWSFFVKRGIYGGKKNILSYLQEKSFFLGWQNKANFRSKMQEMQQIGCFLSIN